MPVNWISGACDSEPEPPGGLPLHLIETGLEAAVSRMEAVEGNLAYFAGELPTEPLEQAALETRVRKATEELRLLWDAVAKIGGRAEREERERGGVIGRTASAPRAIHGGGASRRSLFVPWPGLVAWLANTASGSGDIPAGPV